MYINPTMGSAMLKSSKMKTWRWESKNSVYTLKNFYYGQVLLSSNGYIRIYSYVSKIYAPKNLSLDGLFFN